MIEALFVEKRIAEEGSLGSEYVRQYLESFIGRLIEGGKEQDPSLLSFFLLNHFYAATARAAVLRQDLFLSHTF